KRFPNSVDTLAPNNRFVVAINKVPVTPGIPYYTILGDRGRGDSPNSSDGVVPYWSSHLDAARSEFIAPCNHSSPLNPQAIAEVPPSTGRNRYLITSEYGEFEADGNIMLERRIKEVAAIRKLKEVSRTDEYKKALKAAVASPLGVAKDVVTNPVGTVTGIPKGLFKFVNRTGQSVKERTQGRERNPYEDSNAASLVGFSKAKRTVAIQLG